MYKYVKCINTYQYLKLPCTQARWHNPWKGTKS